jgi:putative membrane protein
MGVPTSLGARRDGQKTQGADVASDTNVPAGTAIQHAPDLGVMRTMMAADRTLMAWIRTSLSMLTFGYTIYKVLQEIHEIGKIAIRDTAPRNAGVLLTVSGTVALMMGIAEYWWTLKLLRQSYLFGLPRPALIISILMATAGVILSAGILWRVL